MKVGMWHVLLWRQWHRGGKTECTWWCFEGCHRLDRSGEYKHYYTAVIHQNIQNIHQSILSKGKYVKIKLLQVNHSNKVITFMTPKVLSISIHKVSNPFSAIKAAVLPSQRMDKVYETIAVVYNTTGNVYYHRSGNFHVKKCTSHLICSNL